MEPEKWSILLSEITGSRFQSIVRQTRPTTSGKRALRGKPEIPYPEMNPAYWGNKMDPGWYVWGSSKVLEGYRQIRKAVKLLRTDSAILL